MSALCIFINIKLLNKQAFLLENCAISLFGVDMLFTDKVKQEKDILLQKWVDKYYAAYPLGSTGFIRTSTDKFKNPIGIITQTSLSTLYDAVIGDDIEFSDVHAALNELVKLRAIQEMPASRAVGPMAQLKTLFKEEVFDNLVKNNKDSKVLQEIFEDFFTVAARIDGLLLLSMDLYSADREKVFNLRVEEIHRSQSQVIRWARLREEKMSTNNNSEE